MSCSRLAAVILAVGERGALVNTAEGTTAFLPLEPPGPPTDVDLARLPMSSEVSVTVAPDGHSVLASADDRPALLFDGATQSGETSALGALRHTRARATAWSSDSKLLAIAVRSGLRVVDPSGKNALAARGATEMPSLHTVALTRDGRMAVTGGVAEAFVWDVATGRLLTRIAPGGPLIAHAGFTGDGAVVLDLLAEDGGLARTRFDVRSGAMLGTTTSPTPCLQARFDAHRLVCLDRELPPFAPDRMRGTYASLQKHEAPLGWSPNRAWTVMPSPEESADFNEVVIAGPGGSFALKLPLQHESRPSAVSDDGKWLVTVGRDEAVDVYDTAWGARIATLVGEQAGAVNAIALADGGVLATASNEGSLLVWNTRARGPGPDAPAPTALEALPAEWRPMFTRDTTLRFALATTRPTDTPEPGVEAFEATLTCSVARVGGMPGYLVTKLTCALDKTKETWPPPLLVDGLWGATADRLYALGDGADLVVSLGERSAFDWREASPIPEPSRGARRSDPPPTVTRRSDGARCVKWEPGGAKLDERCWSARGLVSWSQKQGQKTWTLKAIGF